MFFFKKKFRRIIFRGNKRSSNELNSLDFRTTYILFRFLRRSPHSFSRLQFFKYYPFALPQNEIKFSLYRKSAVLDGNLANFGATDFPRIKKKNHRNPFLMPFIVARRRRILNTSQPQERPAKGYFHFVWLRSIASTILGCNSEKVFWPRNAQDIPTSVKLTRGSLTARRRGVT